MIKAVVDSNVIISSIIASLGASRLILDAWRAKEFVIVTSPGIIQEVARKLSHPRIRGRYHVTDEDREAIVSQLRMYAEVWPGVTPIREGSRDPSDDMVLATAVESGANCIVSGDKDLLEMGSYERVQIVTPARFLTVLSIQRDK